MINYRIIYEIFSNNVKQIFKKLKENFTKLWEKVHEIILKIWKFFRKKILHSDEISWTFEQTFEETKNNKYLESL